MLSSRREYTGPGCKASRRAEVILAPPHQQASAITVYTSSKPVAVDENVGISAWGVNDQQPAQSLPHLSMTCNSVCKIYECQLDPNFCSTLKFSPKMFQHWRMKKNTYSLGSLLKNVTQHQKISKSMCQQKITCQFFIQKKTTTSVCVCTASVPPLYARTIYIRSPRILRASCMSLGIIVTRFACKAHSCVSWKIPTR
jgi:hypothetical protein